MEGVLQSRSSGAAQFSISATGSLVYVSGGIQSVQSRLVWVSRNGQSSLARPATLTGPRFLLTGGGGRGIKNEAQIWLYDLSRETLTRLTFEGAATLSPSGRPMASGSRFN